MAPELLGGLEQGSAPGSGTGYVASGQELVDERGALLAQLQPFGTRIQETSIGRVEARIIPARRIAEAARVVTVDIVVGTGFVVAHRFEMLGAEHAPPSSAQSDDICLVQEAECAREAEVPSETGPVSPVSAPAAGAPRPVGALKRF